MDGPPLSARPTAKSRMPQTPRPSTDPATDIATSDRLLEDSPTLGSLNPNLGAQPPLPGPARYISYKAVDPEKLKPYSGPVLPQQPPPTKPPPPPPAFHLRRPNIVGGGLETESKEVNRTVLPTLPKSNSDIMTSAKHSTPSVKSKASTACHDSLDSMNGQKSVKRLRTALRQKVSTLFGDDVSTPSVPCTTEADHDSMSVSIYRPISMHSLDPESNSFSDIFDDVFNATRDSESDLHRSSAPPFVSARPSKSVSSKEVIAHETAPRKRGLSRVTTAATSRDEVAHRLAARLGVTDSASRAAICAALDEVAKIAPPLTGHPAIRGDLPLQARLGMIEDPSNNAALRESRGHAAPLPTHAAALRLPPLYVGRQRPTQVAVSTRSASRSIASVIEPSTGYTTRTLVAAPDVTRTQGDVDFTPTFDRSVDLTWYRYANRPEHGVRESRLPHLAKMFDAHSTVFMVKHSRGRESMSTKYDHLRRFPYHELDGSIRFKIMEKLLEDYLPGKPVLLNHARQASPAWPEDAFASLWEVLGPLQNVLTACPRLRADVMTALLMTQPFHVIFSPYVKPNTQPLPTKWLLKYVHFMQDVRVELDMTKLGFGHTWQATGLSTRLWDIGNLVHTFVAEVLRRDPRANPMAHLTIHCRRFFGYRQGENPHHGDVAFYKSPVGKNDEQKPSAQPAGRPWNHGHKSASFPPSANNPYSGHRRHHGGGPEQVPFLHEGHMSVADPFHKLTGRVWSVRVVGMSEKWTMKFHNFWPKLEFDAVSKESLGLHIDRYTPSRHSYAAPGHAIFLDYGIRAGLHRFPPLPDSEPMVCAAYDAENDVFLEVGSGNILTVKENGVEVIARSENPPIPRRDLPYRGGSPVSLDGLTTAVAVSRIPGPVGRRLSPTMQAMRKGTPKKALQLLGFEEESGDDDDDDDSVVLRSDSPTLSVDPDVDFLTPTASRVPSADADHTPRPRTSAGVDTVGNH
ncbi:unnamed protein product [Discula destructiva]